MNFLFLIIGVLVGALVLYLVLKPRLKAVKLLDESISLKNDELRAELLELSKEQSSLTAKRDEVLLSISTLQEQAQSAHLAAAEAQKQAEEYSKNIYQKSYELANEKMSQAADEMAFKYQDLKESYERDYLENLEDITFSLNQQINDKVNELHQIEEQLKSVLIQIKAGTEALDRQKLIQETPEDYTINLSTDALEDIKKLFVIKKELHNPRVLLMLIWSNFVKTPLDTLCDKTFGKNEVCGIYKITNLITNEMYIGQSVQCKERMHQHFKKGLGIDTPNGNKLYNNMQQYGVWNFSIELLESCPREQLNEKEKYYITLYQSNYSLNSTAGNNS